MFGRATITLGIGPHSSSYLFLMFMFVYSITYVGIEATSLRPQCRHDTIIMANVYTGSKMWLQVNNSLRIHIQVHSKVDG